MTVTLKPILDTLGYSTPDAQRGVVKLMLAAGAFGDVKGVDGVLSDKQADAVLHNVTFNDLPQAAKLLHDVTQASMIRRPPGVERGQCEEPEAFRANRSALLGALRQAGMQDAVKPTQKYYDHVLVMGATEAEVDKRLDYLRELWDQGVRFGRIHLLGSQRALTGEEKSQGHKGANGSESRSEMDMMENRYYAKSAHWPEAMKDVRVFEVNTYNKENGRRANTKDTVESWHNTNPSPGEVLVISSQPYVKYQDAAVKAVLPRSFHAETVGAEADRDMKISVAMDSIARQIDVGFDKLMERLKMRRPKLETQLVLIDPKDIQVDAKTYQFRSGGDAMGVTSRGKHTADQWDPILHGDPILVHEKLDGSVFVADGHHRVDLAKRLNEKGAGPGKMAALVLREADGYSAQDVKIIAAYKNIAHGKCDVVDTARVFKEAHSGAIDLDKLPHLQMDKGNLSLAFTLSKLSDKALDEVARGEIAPEAAANVAKKVPHNEGRQEKIIAMVKQKLDQTYEMTENSKPTKIQINVFNFNAPGQSVNMSGFAGKVKRERAAETSYHLAS